MELVGWNEWRTDLSRRLRLASIPAQTSSGSRDLAQPVVPQRARLEQISSLTGLEALVQNLPDGVRQFIHVKREIQIRDLAIRLWA